MKYSVIARAFIVSALVLVALAVATPASAQGVGTLRGKVVDASGKVSAKFEGLVSPEELSAAFAAVAN